MARSIFARAGPCGSRVRSRCQPTARTSASKSRMMAPSLRMRCCSSSTSAWSRTWSMLITSPLTTGRWSRRSQPAAVERGTPNAATMFTSPVAQTRSRSRWSYARCGRFCDEAIADHRRDLKDDANRAAGVGPGGQRASIRPELSRTGRHFSNSAVEISPLRLNSSGVMWGGSVVSTRAPGHSSARRPWADD